MARERGLSAVALTDHDTTAGLAEAARAAEEVGIEFVTGVEVETKHRRGTLHVLGYGIDPASAVLQRALAGLVERRHERNRKIVDRLAGLGVAIDYDKIVAATPGGVVGRPHLASALVRCGAVADASQAFARYLAEGAAAWVQRETLSADEAIDVIRGAGGVASLAHPSKLRYESSLELETLLRRLRDAGLTAIEVYHPDHRDGQTRAYVEMALRLDLAMTGGSDFHHARGEPIGKIGFARVRVSYDLLAPLLDGRRNTRAT